MSVIRPIKPCEVAKMKAADFPAVVIESFNELIGENFSGSEAVVPQKDVVKLLVAKGLDRSKIFKNHWLDVEGLFRSAGWSVEYESPDRDESFEPFFRFRLVK